MRQAYKKTAAVLLALTFFASPTFARGTASQTGRSRAQVQKQSTRPYWASTGFSFSSDEAVYLLEGTDYPVENGFFVSGDGVSEASAIINSITYIASFAAADLARYYTDSYNDTPLEVYEEHSHTANYADLVTIIDTYQSDNGRWYALVFISTSDIVKAAVTPKDGEPYMEVTMIVSDISASQTVTFGW